MPETTVFDDRGEFTAGFKFKIGEYLRSIPLSDKQVESITKALSRIMKESQLVDAERQKKALESILTPLRVECTALRSELTHLEGVVEAHQNQAEGMVKLVKIISAVLTIGVALLAIFYEPSPEKEVVKAEVIKQLVKELKEAK